jgi:hypothetical protein
MSPITPRLFTGLGALGALVGLLGTAAGGVMALTGAHHGPECASYSLVMAVFSVVVFVVGLDLWSDYDRLQEYDL